MFKSVSVKNFGALKDVSWNGLSRINLVLGENGTGKSFLLKAMYVALRTCETYKRGDDKRDFGDILSDKLYWTFQAEKIGDIATKSKDKKDSLNFCAEIDESTKLSYSFGRDTEKQIKNISGIPAVNRLAESIFLPAKEVVSLQKIIIKSREQDRLFGFDNTYYDLARALNNPTMRGRSSDRVADVRSHLEDMLGGRLEKDEDTQNWYFKDQNAKKFLIGVVAEGIKKVSILDILLGNRYLSPESVVFIDEPESALHPAAISKFMNIIYELSLTGMQFIMATHSYFVLKKLYLLATEHQCSIPVLSLGRERHDTYDLKDGLPDNGSCPIA